MSSYQQHPIGALVPPPTNDEFSRLTESIKTEGYDSNQPVWLYEDKVLDGWSRYQASVQAGVEPDFQKYTGNKPHHFVLTRNVIRRHLNPSQAACVKAAMIDELARESGRQRKDIILEISDQSGISAKDVASLEIVGKEGSQELKAAVFDGVIKPAKAAVVAKKSEIEQKQIATDSRKTREKRYEEREKVKKKKIKESIAARARGDSYEGDEEPDPSDIRDANGYPVPKKLADLFATVDWYDEAIRAIEKVAREARSMLPNNPYMLQKVIEDSTKNTITAIRRSKPYSIHQNCRGKGCKSCMNCGWLTKEQDAKLKGDS